MHDNTHKPKIVMVCGYFDVFSGYQEVSLAKSLAPISDLVVVSSDRVNPTFSDAHLESIKHPRLYEPGLTRLDGYSVRRIRTREFRSMVFPLRGHNVLRTLESDLTIQIMPGQYLPSTASRHRNLAPRIALYGDNDAMYANVAAPLRALKRAAFYATKGILYSRVNLRAKRVFGYTPNTVKIIGRLPSGPRPEVFPLTYDETIFNFEPTIRESVRSLLGLRAADKLVILAGKPSRQKQYESAIEAVSQLPDNYHLAIVGTGEDTYSHRVSELAETRLGTRAHMFPFCASRDLAGFFNAADVGVWPRMPAVTIQQAMGTGLPVVIPNNDIVSHLLSRGGAGELLRAEKPDASEIKHALIRATEKGIHSEDRSEMAGINSWLSGRAAAKRLGRLAANNERRS